MPDRTLRRGAQGLSSLFVLASFALLTNAAAAQGPASIATDGTLGPPGQDLIAVENPQGIFDYRIDESLGAESGANLFFSFSRFGLTAQESATFAGPANIERVISRVTGPGASEIDGLLRSEIDGADFYLLNPNGVMFGPNATLDINGAFHASTADMLELAPGAGEAASGEFHARFPERTVLSTDPVAAFQFLTGDPADITVRGSQLETGTRVFSPGSGFPEARGHALSFIGGDVRVHGGPDPDKAGFVFTGGGRLDIVSLDSAGRVDVSVDAAPVVHADALGDVTIADGAAVVTGGPPPNDPFVFVDGSGDVNIRARNLTLRDAEVRAITTSFKQAGRIRIDLDGDFVASTGGQSETTGLVAGSGLDLGQLGPIPFSEHKALDSSTQLVTIKWSQRFGELTGLQHIASGPAGDIEVSAQSVSLLEGAKLSSSGVFGGDGGNIRVDARGTVTLSGADVDGDVGGIFSNAQLEGNAGTIQVNASELVIDERAGIFGEVRGGDGAGGAIQVSVDRLSIDGSGRIDTSTRGTGSGGSVDVVARESITLRGRLSEEEFSGITTISQPEASGDAGSLRVTAPIIRLDDGAGISTASLGAGSGGDLAIAADRLFLDASEVRVDTVGTRAASAPPRGGNLRIDTTELLDASASLISARSAEGPGGNVTLTSGRAIVLRDGTTILADAPLGAGGRIEISSPLLIRTPDTVFDASGGTEQGEVVLNSPDSALLEQVQPPPTSFLDASSMLLATCASRRTGDRAGSLTVARWPGVPLSPEGPLLAFSRLGAEAAPDSVPLSDGSESIQVATTSDEALRGDALRGAARDRQVAGEFAASLAPLEEALALARASGDATREAAALGELGNAYQALREPNRAAALLDEAADLAQRADDPVLAASLQNNLGNHYAIQGDLDAALSSYDASTTLAASVGDHLGEARSAANAARAALARDSAEDVAARLARARELVPEGEPSRETVSLQIHLATSGAELAVASDAQRRAQLLASHGLLIRAIAGATALRDERLLSLAQGQLAALYELEGEREREALYLSHQAERAAERAGAPELLARWHRQAGGILWATGDVDSALESFRRAEELVSEARPEVRARYGASDADFEREVAPIYTALLDALLQRAAADPDAEQARLREARQVAERWKVAELRDYFRDECVAELEAHAQPVEEISATAAVLHPIVLPDRIELLVSLSDGIQRHSVRVDAVEVAKTVAEFRRTLTKRTSRQYLRPARQLHAWLVEPYAEALVAAKIDTLVFVPDGPLRQVPMAALHDGERFLVEQLAVAVTPSLNLIAPKPLDPASTRMLLAGMSEEVEGYPGLAFVPAELASIRDLYGGEVLLNDEFRTGRLAEELRERPPGVVHLASHAEFSPHASSSFILTHDGPLKMDQLAELVESSRFGEDPLELLVLSACETAAGDDRAALGLAGVAVRAGARSAMGSLWSVSDRATSQLVVDFYRELGEPETSKAEALRRAQLALLAREGFEHPFYWAPFLMINNWL